MITVGSSTVVVVLMAVFMATVVVVVKERFPGKVTLIHRVGAALDQEKG